MRPSSPRVNGHIFPNEVGKQLVNNYSFSLFFIIMIPLFTKCVTDEMPLAVC